MGNLYIAATPIGNLKDITIRVLDVLNDVDFIVCEDTRHTLNLLNHFNISKKLISYHEYSSKDKINHILSLIQEGYDVAYVSDAGTPAISDPGRVLVQEARINGINVIGLPGPCAAVCAYSISGLLSKRFVFYGFLSDKTSVMLEEIKDLNKSGFPVILYVSPHKLIKTLTVLNDVYDNKLKITVCRELTKLYEETIIGNTAFLLDYFHQNNPRGEFVLIIEFLDVKEDKIDYSVLKDKINKLVSEGLSAKDAIKVISAESGVSKNELYLFYHND